VKKAKDLFGSLEGIRVSVLGLAFKPDTDDIREAASLTIVNCLLAEGASIIAYDPVAVPNARVVLGNTVDFTADIQTALSGAELVIIATEWDHIKHLPLEKYAQLMKTPVIVDGRNCYSLKDVAMHSITYISIGRPAIHIDHFKRHDSLLNPMSKGRYDETLTSILRD